MLRVIVATLALTFAAACSEGNNGEREEPAPVPTNNEELAACRYQLHDDLSGEVSPLDTIPTELEPTAVFESGDDLLVTVEDAADPARDLTLVVPACKKAEAEPFLEGLSP